MTPNNLIATRDYLFLCIAEEHNNVSLVDQLEEKVQRLDKEIFNLLLESNDTIQGQSLGCSCSPEHQ